MSLLRSLTLLAACAAGCALAPQARANIQPGFSACVQDPLRENSGRARVTSSVNPARRNPVTGVVRWHKGVDLAIGIGTPVYAANDGVITAKWASGGGGQSIRLTGGAGGYTTVYFHLSKYLVKNGDTVRVGQPIALVGNTGVGTGPHLHFEIWKGKEFSKDPKGLYCGGSPTPGGYAGEAGYGDQPDGEPMEAYAGKMPEVPNMEAWDDMSVREIIEAEVGKRYQNTAWLAEEAERSAAPLRVEALHMRALKIYIDQRRNDQKARVELLMAQHLARNVNREMEVRMDRQRAAASKAASSNQ
ncbi:M23 family metallopeptidase [Pseudoxanthomonas sp. LjRoot168]|uniref:M23 family metallopeptidase n=1 Tax=unclassified Pseudoxanthomonas TaxID=2645906 RepID=UPI003ECF419C